MNIQYNIPIAKLLFHVSLPVLGSSVYSRGK